MSKKKTIAIVSIVALIAVAFVGMTLAYFTDTTAEAENVFTIGKVKITLSETPVDEDGKADGELTVIGTEIDGEPYMGNKYLNLMPGVQVDKDPTVTVLADSADCYVRMKVTLDNAKTFYAVYKSKYGATADMNEAIGSVMDYFVGYEDVEDLWVVTADGYEYDAENDAITVTFNYAEVVESSDEDTKLYPIITGVKLPEWITNDQAALFEDGFSVKIIAEAIQADSFEDADEAWAAFDAQAAGN